MAVLFRGTFSLQFYAELSHKYCLPYHTGGIGSKTYYELAMMCGIDSVDSGLPMIHRTHFNNAVNMNKVYQQNLFLASTDMLFDVCQYA